MGLRGFTAQKRSSEDIASGFDRRFTNIEDRLNTLESEEAGVHAERITMWHVDSLVTAGNALALTIDAAQIFNHQAAQSAAADADSFTQSFVLRAGTYTIKFTGITDSGSGLIDWELDDTNIVTGQDWYSLAATRNVTKSVSITVTGNGRHLLTGTVNGKNVASSGFSIKLTSIVILPAADSKNV